MAEKPHRQLLVRCEIKNRQGEASDFAMAVEVGYAAARSASDLAELGNPLTADSSFTSR